MSRNIVQAKMSILIVLYKRHYRESAAITTLLSNVAPFRAQGIDVEFFVWNNTPECSPALSAENLTWLEGDNDGLAYIYNRVADMAFAGGATHFMISDDDTDYSSQNYVEAISRALEFQATSAADLFGVMVPKVYSREKLVSPGLRFWFFGRLSDDVDSGINSSRNKLAINSGVIFNKFCYEKMSPLFDERLKFYATDTAFFVRYESFYPHFYVLDTCLQHDLSEHTSDSAERAIFRFQEMILGLRVIFEHKGYLFHGFMEAYLLVSSLRKSLSYKNTGFFRSYYTSFKGKNNADRIS